MKVEKEYQLIESLRKQAPLNYLTLEYIYDKDSDLKIPIGIFSCISCSIPINHHQIAWSGLCGKCDMGKKSLDWLIVKPDEFECIERILERDDMKSIQRVHGRVKENMTILFMLQARYQKVLDEIRQHEKYVHSGMMLQ